MKKYLFGVVLTVLIIGGVLFVRDAQAAADRLTGWAWSSNIGWISLNYQNSGANVGGPPTPIQYSVKVSPGGQLSDYAWSSSVGWISFNSADLNGCSGVNPSSDGAKINNGTGKVDGWVRALTAKDRITAGFNDGWDGCIELSGANHTSPNSASNASVTGNSPFLNLLYLAGGVTRTGNHLIAGIVTEVLRGFAWGGPVIGWLNFDAKLCEGTGCVGTPVPSMSLQVYDTTSGWSPSTTINLPPGASSATVQVRWNPQNVSQVQASTYSAPGRPPTFDWPEISVNATSYPIPGGDKSFGTPSYSDPNSTSGVNVTFPGIITNTTKYLALTYLKSGSTQHPIVVTTINIIPFNSPTLSCVQPPNTLTCSNANYINPTSVTPILRANDMCLSTADSPGVTGNHINCEYQCRPGFVLRGNSCQKSTTEEF